MKWIKFKSSSKVIKVTIKYKHLRKTKKKEKKTRDNKWKKKKKKNDNNWNQTNFLESKDYMKFFK